MIGAAPRLFTGTVIHKRLRPAAHAFRYPVAFITLPLTELDRAGNALFGVDKPRLFSIRLRDYGPGDGTPPQVWLRALLAREGVTNADGAIVLQTFPRMLGYAFNPVSFWYCEDAAGGVRAIVAEVNNTFGERHCYLLTRGDGSVIHPGESIIARKVFHVSPFFPVEGHYRFRFRIGTERLLARIDYFDRDGDLLHTSVSGEGGAWSAGAFARLALTHGWASALIIARIHFQALKLMAKRVPFYRKPRPPEASVTASLPKRT